MSFLDLHLNRTQQTMIAGGIAGSVSKTVTAPLSRLTILYQVHAIKMGPESIRYNVNESLLSVVRSVNKQEGLKSFWKGNFTAVIHRFPYSAVNFGVYDFIKKRILIDDKGDGAFIRLFCGALAGLCACTACYPLDLIRTRLSVVGSYKGITDAFIRVAREEGFRGLYSGLVPALGVAVPQLAINYSVYGTLKENLLKDKEGVFADPVTGKLSNVGGILCGAISGAMASLLTFPSDVLRRRMQVRGVTEGHPHLTLLAETKEIWRTQKMVGFYRGITPELLKVIPMVSITFYVFEAVANFFGIEHAL